MDPRPHCGAHTPLREGRCDAAPRVAESLYWAGRYLERAEATARLILVHTELYLDLPLSTGIGWAPLLAVTGTSEDFCARYAGLGEEDIVCFLAIDRDNPSSILASLSQARNNLRTSRAVLPSAAWEVVATLQGRANATPAGAVDRRCRSGWMLGVIRQCQLLAGMLAGTMCHDDAYAFLQMGAYIERADMTTRVLDVQAGTLILQRKENQHPYSDVTWMSVLRSLCAHQMFRRSAHCGVSGPEALRFLLKHRQFPRSVEHCLTRISQVLLELPHYEAAMVHCAAVQRTLEDAPLPTLTAEGLHDFADQLQIGIAALHNVLTGTYFRTAPAASRVISLPA